MTSPALDGTGARRRSGPHITTFSRRDSRWLLAPATNPVLLSGAGTDGTLGLAAIKEKGGLTLAQSAKTAAYDSMVLSTINTGLVDIEMPVEQMPAKLVDHFRHLEAMRGRAGIASLLDGVTDQLQRISAILRKRTGHDFSEYKERTMSRLIQRRTQVLQIDAVPRYIECLDAEPSEADRLFRDLLIGVTQFFRDPDAFKHLEETIVAPLLEGKTADDEVRIWVSGCATGEEAYSIAILFQKRMAQLDTVPKVQVLVSDIDEKALQFAHSGRYPKTIEADILHDRLARFFRRENGGYRVCGARFGRPSTGWPRAAALSRGGTSPWEPRTAASPLTGRSSPSATVGRGNYLVLFQDVGLRRGERDAEGDAAETIETDGVAAAKGAKWASMTAQSSAVLLSNLVNVAAVLVSVMKPPSYAIAPGCDGGFAVCHGQRSLGASAACLSPACSRGARGADGSCP